MKRYKVTHIMNKKQLILILVAGLLSSTASAVTLNSDPTKATGSVVIASEIAASQLKTVTGDAYDVMGTAGFIIPAGAGYFARFDVGGAKFGTALDENSVTGLGDAFEIAAGGGVDDDYAVVSVGNSSSGVIALGSIWTLENVTYNIEDNKDKEDVTFKYTLYENAGDALNEESPLSPATQSGKLIEFKAATAMAVKPTTNVKKIEVASGGKLFVGDSDSMNKVSTIMEINLDTTEAMAGYADTSLDDPTLVTIAEKVDFTATGNFGSINLGDKDGFADDKGKVWLDSSPECLISATDDNDTPDDPSDDVTTNYNLGRLEVNRVGDSQLTAEIELPASGNSPSDPTDPTSNPDGTPITLADYGKAYLCLETDGETEIPEVTQGFKGRLEMTANENFVPHPVVSDTGSILEKNADSAEVNFLLTPDGVYTNYVRLSNTSNVRVDNLRVTLYNDEGVSQSFSLNDIEGVTDELAPYASTKLININELYAAAQAVELDEGEDMFTAIDTDDDGRVDGKLRARVDGSFLAGSIEIQALSRSRDYNLFFTF